MHEARSNELDSMNQFESDSKIFQIRLPIWQSTTKSITRN